MMDVDLELPNKFMKDQSYTCTGTMTVAVS